MHCWTMMTKTTGGHSCLDIMFCPVWAAHTTVFIAFYDTYAGELEQCPDSHHLPAVLSIQPVNVSLLLMLRCREHSFEVALFAELFQEMLQQRFGRAILRALDAIDAAKPKRSASRRDGKDDGKDDSKAAPGSAGKKRERSAEPAEGDVEMADTDKQAAADAGDSAAAAKRQKTEAAAGERLPGWCKGAKG